MQCRPSLSTMARGGVRLTSSELSTGCSGSTCPYRPAVAALIPCHGRLVDSNVFFLTMHVHRIRGSAPYWVLLLRGPAFCLPTTSGRPLELPLPRLPPLWPSPPCRKYAKVEKIPGGAMEDSRVLRGVMFEKDVVVPARMRR